MKINNRKIGINFSPYIIAEVSANHQQSLSRAKKIIFQAKKAGADAVKIQSFDLNEMTLDLNKKDFVIRNKDNIWYKRNLYNLYKQAQTPKDWHKKIFDYCKKIKITCFTSVFDLPTLKFLKRFNLPAYKVASFENNHLPLITELAKAKKPLIISTGMCKISDIYEIHKILKKYKCKNFALLKCTSAYPTNPKESNISAIKKLRSIFKCNIGLSDHTKGIGAAVASISHGATIIEKHIVLKKKDKSLDEKFSLDPKQFEDLVKETKNAWLAQGKNKQTITKSEKKFLFLKRSIYLSRNVKKNEKVNNSNIKIIRPAYGLHPKYLNRVIKKKFKNNYKIGTPLKLPMLKK